MGTLLDVLCCQIDGFRPRSVSSWKGPESASTLRLSFKDDAAQVWVNGEPACDRFKLKHPLGPFRVCVAAMNGNEPFDCQFDSIRIWRARQAPPIKSLPIAEPRKPLYENDFSASMPAWHGFNVEGEWRSSISGGRLHFESLGISWKALVGDDVPRIDSAADVEVVGRAASGLWGFSAPTGQSRGKV